MAMRTQLMVVIDDDQLFSDSVKRHFESQQLQVMITPDGHTGLELCRRHTVDVVLLDQQLPDTNGVALCQPILESNDQTKIIFITAFPSFSNAVKAIKIGAFDYLSKPFDLAELELAINRCLLTLGLENTAQVQKYKSELENRETVLIGQSPAMTAVRSLIKVAGQNQSPVLITGETGTGKGVAARCIHNNSRQSEGPFIAINCAALPENLIEAELFGYEKGAFTGATANRKGVFEMASGGTLFLDELGELPAHLQTKLLGALDEMKIKRLGSQKIRSVNTRVIAATNVDIALAVESGRFRRDLFYRLGVLLLNLPPLGDHVSDIPDLCRHFLKLFNAGSQRHIPDPQYARLMAYDWPGNVRELRNIIERSLIVTAQDALCPASLLTTATAGNPAALSQPSAGTAPSTLDAVEKAHILQTLAFFEHNHTHAAQSLGVSRSTLIRKIKKYGL